MLADTKIFQGLINEQKSGEDRTRTWKANHIISSVIKKLSFSYLKMIVVLSALINFFGHSLAGNKAQH